MAHFKNTVGLCLLVAVTLQMVTTLPAPDSWSGTTVVSSPGTTGGTTTTTNTTTTNTTVTGNNSSTISVTCIGSGSDPNSNFGSCGGPSVVTCGDCNCNCSSGSGYSGSSGYCSGSGSSSTDFSQTIIDLFYQILNAVVGGQDTSTSGTTGGVTDTVQN